MPIELTLTFNETRFLPLTTLTYRASKDSSKIQSGTIKMRDMERAVRADADLIELALRYRQKRVDRATLSVDGIEFLDADGDGLVELETESASPKRCRPGAWWFGNSPGCHASHPTSAACSGFMTSLLP